MIDDLEDIRGKLRSKIGLPVDANKVLAQLDNYARLLDLARRVREAQEKPHSPQWHPEKARPRNDYDLDIGQYSSCIVLSDEAFTNLKECQRLEAELDALLEIGTSQKKIDISGTPPDTSRT